MKDERYKEIMEQLGMPNSTSLLLALQQVENEVTQAIESKEKNTSCAENKYQQLAAEWELQASKSRDEQEQLWLCACTADLKTLINQLA